MPVSRTAATAAAGASESAASASAYAANEVTPAAIAGHPISARTLRKPTRGRVGEDGGDGDRQEHELEVGERRGVLDALVVDERVPRNGRSDHEREHDSLPVDGPGQPANEEHAATDEHDSERLPGAERDSDNRSAEQHENRCHCHGRSGRRD